MNLVSQSTLMVSAEVHPEVIIRMVGSATKLEGVEWGVGALEHARVTLARVLQLLPQPLTCVQRVQGERKEKSVEEALEEAVSTRCLCITKVTRINQNLTAGKSH